MEEATNVSNEEAKESLDVIEDAMARCRKGIAATGAPYLIIWGAVWIAGFASVHFLGVLGGWVFTGLDFVGIVLSVVVGAYYRRNGPVRSAADRKMLWRIMWFWIAVFGYIGLWLAMMGSYNPLKCTALVCTAVMFAYVVMGLWLAVPYLAYTGVGVTGMTAVGFYLLPGYFMLWMAVFGGGALFGTGIYIRRHWR